MPKIVAFTFDHVGGAAVFEAVLTTQNNRRWMQRSLLPGGKWEVKFEVHDGEMETPQYELLPPGTPDPRD